jgi:hypothetical protein
VALKNLNVRTVETLAPFRSTLRLSTTFSHWYLGQELKNVDFPSKPARVHDLYARSDSSSVSRGRAEQVVGSLPLRPVLLACFVRARSG